jgi:hypothetical protein
MPNPVTAMEAKPPKTAIWPNWPTSRIKLRQQAKAPEPAIWRTSQPLQIEVAGHHDHVADRHAEWTRRLAMRAGSPLPTTRRNRRALRRLKEV